MSGGFLDRWSRRKLASAGKALLADAPVPGVPSAAAPEPGGQDTLRPAGAGPASAAATGAEAATSAAEAQLPPVEGLTLASDFTAFLKDEVSDTLRRQALHKLFADPHFNRMDGLDIYIDDYSLPDPIPPEAMAKLKHAREWLMANEAEAEAEALEAAEAAAAKDDSPAGQAEAERDASQAEASQGASAEIGDEAVPIAIPGVAQEAIESGQKAP